MSHLYEGQKVVCINDQFAPEYKELFTALPKKDLTYVIRDIELGVTFEGGQRNTAICLRLVGLTNPACPPPASKERGFNSDRFRPLDEMPPSKMTRQTSPGMVSRQPVESEDLAVYNPNGGPCEDWEQPLKVLTLLLKP